MSSNSSAIKKLIRLFIVFTLVSLPIDQWTKSLSREFFLVHEDDGDTTIYQGKRQEVVSLGGDDAWMLLNLTYVRNHGASWGVMKDFPENYRPLVLISLGLLFSLALFGVAVWFSKNGEAGVASSLVLMVAGSLGNLVDRVRLGYVVDFISLKSSAAGRSWALPSFNVADMIIVVSLICLITMLLKKNKKP